MTEYYILAWLSLYYALVVLSALVGFWIRNKYFENEKITQIEYGIVSEKPILCKMVAYSDSQLRFYTQYLIYKISVCISLFVCMYHFFSETTQPIFTKLCMETLSIYWVVLK